MRKFITKDIVFWFILLLFGIGGFFFAVAWPQTEGFYAFVVSAALGGFGVSCYIYYAKRYKKRLACPAGSDCNAVVASKYSVFFGIPLEYWGIGYFGSIFATYSIFIFFPFIQETIFLPIILLLTSSAFLFSMYLIFVQAFLLRKWCIWCLLAATMSSAIFLSSLISVETAGSLLTGITPALALIKNLGFILGVGGATASMFLFIKFLDDFNIDDREARAIKGISEMIWLGLGLIFMSEYARYVSQPQQLAQSSTFLVQIIALSVVFFSGAVLKIIFAPFLAIMPFHKQKVPAPSLESLRKAAFVSGAISLSSWYFAFVLNYIPEYKFSSLLASFTILLVAAVLISLLWNRRIGITKQKKEIGSIPKS